MDRGLVPGHARGPHHGAEHRAAPLVQQPYLYDVLGEHVQAGRLEVLGGGATVCGTLPRHSSERPSLPHLAFCTRPLTYLGAQRSK